ncbi:hypothetical protein VPH35_117688 [Triticum aestivum]
MAGRLSRNVRPGVSRAGSATREDTPLARSGGILEKTSTERGCVCLGLLPCQRRRSLFASPSPPAPRSPPPLVSAFSTSVDGLACSSSSSIRVHSGNCSPVADRNLSVPP